MELVRLPQPETAKVSPIAMGGVGPATPGFEWPHSFQTTPS